MIWRRDWQGDKWQAGVRIGTEDTVLEGSESGTRMHTPGAVEKTDTASGAFQEDLLMKHCEWWLIVNDGSHL